MHDEDLQMFGSGAGEEDGSLSSGREESSPARRTEIVSDTEGKKTKVVKRTMKGNSLRHNSVTVA